jgi:hypothetical protein
MITLEDIKRLELPHLTVDQIRRLTNAENTCKIATPIGRRTIGLNVFRKLCEKYGCMDYFRKVIH